MRPSMIPEKEGVKVWAVGYLESKKWRSADGINVFDSHTLSSVLPTSSVLSFSPTTTSLSFMPPSPFRWRRASRKSSTPFFPGAWPNSSAHDSFVTRNDAVDPTDNVHDHTTQLRRITSSLASESSHLPISQSDSADAIHRYSDEPLLEQIDNGTTDFRHLHSLSLAPSQTCSIGSIPTELDLPMDSFRTVSLIENSIYLCITHSRSGRTSTAALRAQR